MSSRVPAIVLLGFLAASPAHAAAPRDVADPMCAAIARVSKDGATKFASLRGPAVPGADPDMRPALLNLPDFEACKVIPDAYSCFTSVTRTAAEASARLVAMRTRIAACLPDWEVTGGDRGAAFNDPARRIDIAMLVNEVGRGWRVLMTVSPALPRPPEPPFCPALETVLADAPKDFASLRGAPIPEEAGRAVSATLSLPKGTWCSVTTALPAMYSCTMGNAASLAAIEPREASLAAEVSACLPGWQRAEQPASGARGRTVEFTRNGVYVSLGSGMTATGAMMDIQIQRDL